MGKVYGSDDEIIKDLEFIPVFDGIGKLCLDVYLDGKKVGGLDKYNKKVKIKVKMPISDEEEIYLDFCRGDKPFTTSVAVFHYFMGGGFDIEVDSANVDIGLKPGDFPGYNALLKSMYRKKKAVDVDEKLDSTDIGGWAAHLTYRLKGAIKSTATEWEFTGYIKPYDDEFDFNALPWGERKYWKELLTRVLGKLSLGEDYRIKFKGRRTVQGGGKWEKY